jgi:transposase
MEHIGIDVHKNQSQICILTADGELIEKRIRTTRERLRSVLGRRETAQILIESATESEWVARCLEELGHEVIVADPNFAPMYAQRTRKIKTDRRDARALAEACRQSNYRRAHRTSDGQRHVRGHLAVRECLVQTRTKWICVVRSLLRREGLRIRCGSTVSFVERVSELELPRPLRQEIAPILRLMVHLNRQIKRADQGLQKIVRQNPVVRRLCTAPGVGPVTATSFVATLDTAERFLGAHQVQAYLGLVPREHSSGEKQQRGRITKAGNRRTRSLLVEAAWAVVRRGKRPEWAPLKAWVEKIAARRGKCIAVVALARKLAGYLYAMMRDGTEFDPSRCGQRSSVAVGA